MIRKRTSLTTSERRQRLFVLLFGIVLLGAGAGTILTVLYQVNTPTVWMRMTGLFFYTDWTLSSLFYEAVGSAVLFLFSLFLLGFSAIGQPFAFFVLTGFGFCIGSAMRFQCQDGNSMMRCLLLLPYFVPLSMLCTIAVRESLRFSGLFTAYGFRDEPADNMYHQIRLYCVRFLVLLIILLCLSALYSFLFYTVVRYRFG